MSLDSVRLNRRAAMRAAAGGAVAAGVFVAPRVAGLSVAPTYAAASSGNSEFRTEPAPLESYPAQADDPPGILCYASCWNSNVEANASNNGSCVCGTNSKCGPSSEVVTGPPLVINTNNGDPITLNYEVWGPTERCDATSTEPSLALNIQGIDPPWQACTVEVLLTCANPSFPAGSFSPMEPGGSEGMLTRTAKKDGSLGPISPQCSGSLNNTLGPSPAAMQITLQCNFEEYQS